jgi:hypothetical protein
VLYSLSMASGERDDWKDPVIEAYKRGIDQTLIVERLRKTPEERLLDGIALQRAIEEMRGAAFKRRDE